LEETIKRSKCLYDQYKGRPSFQKDWKYKKKKIMEQRKKGTKMAFLRNNPQGHSTSREPRMTKRVGKIKRKPPIQCWGSVRDHMYRDCPHRGEKVRIVHNLQEVDTLEKMGRNVTRTYASLDNKQAKLQSHMIKVEGNINTQNIAILIDSGGSCSYIDPNMVEIFHLQGRNFGKSWLVKLATRAKRKINDMAKACPIDMNGLSPRVDFNITPLDFYDCLIRMDWLDQHHDIIDYYNKSFTFLDEEGNLRTVQGIPREVTLIEISTLHLKKSYRKGCQIFVAHMEETPKDKVPNIEEYVVLK
jgi:hypothetical protein